MAWRVVLVVRDTVTADGRNPVSYIACIHCRLRPPHARRQRWFASDCGRFRRAKTEGGGKFIQASVTKLQYCVPTMPTARAREACQCIAASPDSAIDPEGDHMNHRFGHSNPIASCATAAIAPAAFSPRRSLLAAAVIAGVATAAFANVAQAADDGTLTWNGITLYGAVDVGVAYQTHGTPLSQDFYPGLEYLVQKNSNKSITSVAPSGLSQSKIGVKGTENLNDEFSFVFNAEMGFNPTSGNLSDAPKSLIHNNGIALTEQRTAGDGSRAGQFFNGQAWGGFSSKDYGTLTIGRQVTLLGDNVVKYDPMNGSYAFSPIGYSGMTAGMGDTEDVRLDDSVKYFYKYDMFHLGAMYQFGKSDGSPGEAWQGNFGFDYAGFSVDAIYGKKKDAIAAASLSAAQIATLPINSLAATISDNTSGTIAASYTAGPFKVSGGFEHITYENPSLPVTPGFAGLGGYYISVVNNAAFPRDKKVDVSWIGLKYLITKDMDITGAYYHYDQDSYALVSCSTAASAQCSGGLDAYSLRLDYRWTKRFDTYAGVMFSKVDDGLANGYLHTSTADPMIGFRFQF
jgi:predicted porin